MRVCVIGGDGRAHVLADVIGRAAEVIVTPGNPGIAGSVDTSPSEVDADLFVISPEQPLVDGLADRLRDEGKLVFGPGADGARLEGSKAWMKEFVADADVPTARHATFSDVEPALEFLRSLPGLYVIKTDGLAAGKGVLVTENLIEAEDDVRDKLAGTSFGEAGRTVVIEEGMTGPELSLLVLCDGTCLTPLAPAQDFKRIFDGDAGPNTGGMGAYSPVPIAGDDVVDLVMDRFLEPTLAALRKRDIDYRGVLYAGLMLTPDGPKLVEYNVRFGDPEAQVVLPRLTTDLGWLLAEAAGGVLETTPQFGDDACVTVVVAVEGYPVSPRTGDRIDGIDEARAIDGVAVYCAGVGHDSAGRLITAGGRVLDVVASAPTIADARARAYRAIEQIRFPGMQFRTDIAALAAEQEVNIG